MDATPFELSFSVEPDDIDWLGHVNNVVYLRWVQDAAVAHWHELATEQEQARLLWVVVRHEIDYKRQTFLGDVVIARTWVGEALRRNFERHTELLRESDGRILAKARTLWCPIDKSTHKAVAVDEVLRARFSVSSSL